MKKFKLKSEVWLYPGEQAQWHFISVPKKESDIIKTKFGALARGWGSFPVQVQIGKTMWKTSIFPDKKTGTYLLPLKAEVRRREDISVGEKVTFNMQILI